MLVWLRFDGFDFSEIISLFGVSVSDTHRVLCKEKGAWGFGVCLWKIGVRNISWRICRHCRYGVLSGGVELATLQLSLLLYQVKHKLFPSHCPV